MGFVLGRYLVIEIIMQDSVFCISTIIGFNNELSLCFGTEMVSGSVERTLKPTAVTSADYVYVR
jgi:hypothetical protein